jgi:hypothetical protein
MTPERILADLARIDPGERFRAMVRSGLIDEDGRVLGRHTGGDET